MGIREELEPKFKTLLREMHALYETLQSDAPQLPAEALEREAAGVCLKCHKRITQRQKKKQRRGCHESCYATLMRRIREGKTTEYELIAAGKILPTKRGGRKEEPIFPESESPGDKPDSDNQTDEDA